MKNWMLKQTIALVERGWIPISLIRTGIRRLCAQRLESLRAIERSIGHDSMLSEFVSASKRHPVAPVPEKANEQHYEVPAAFFEEVLGKNLKYSSCYFQQDDSTLEQAEVASLKLSCEHAEIKDGMEILELGCGWGSLTCWMAEKYPHSSITAVSNSSSQREFILGRARRLGLADRIEIITADMNDFEIDKKFDRVVSVEMFEHMRNYQELLRRVSSWLKPDGKLFVHIFCHRNYVYEFETTGAANWMGQYFFTGGVMPNEKMFDNFANDLFVEQSWRWDGTHYQRTCRAWHEKMVEKKAKIMPILSQIYGKENASRWFNRWRMFFLAGDELFGYENGQQWQVCHYLFDKVAKPHSDFVEPTLSEVS